MACKNEDFAAIYTALQTVRAVLTDPELRKQLATDDALRVVVLNDIGWAKDATDRIVDAVS